LGGCVGGRVEGAMGRGGAKGLSHEDKRRVMLEMFHTVLEPMNVKEVEKGASSRGVVLGACKDVLQSLVDDGLVEMDKIGGSNLYWSFPASAVAKVQAGKRKAEEALRQAEVEVRRLEGEAREAANAGGEDDARERAELETSVAALDREANELQAKVDAASANDPERHAAKVAGVAQAKAGANRWTDNLFLVQGYVKKTMGVTSREAAKMLNFPQDFDYVE